MGIHYGWYIPDRVIFINFYNKVTAEEFTEMNDALEWMIMESPSDVIHIIQDESNIKSAPPNFSSLIKYSVIAQGKVNGCVLTIGKDISHPVMKFISTIFTRIGNTRHERFYYLEEAEAYLEAVDPEIDLYQAHRHYLEMTLLTPLQSPYATL